MSVKELTEKEYRVKFQLSGCPRCLGRKINISMRTKGGMTYKIYSCADCKGIIRRETIC